MSESLKKRLKNEELFKQLNQQFTDVMETVARTAGKEPAQIGDLFCECGDRNCVARIDLPLKRYREIADIEAFYIVRPGHEDEAIEKIMENHEDYYIIKKMKLA